MRNFCDLVPSASSDGSFCIYSEISLLVHASLGQQVAFLMRKDDCS